jgi:hypothetical protein
MERVELSRTRRGAQSRVRRLGMGEVRTEVGGAWRQKKENGDIRVLKTACWVLGCWAAGVFPFERRLAAVQRTGSSRVRAPDSPRAAALSGSCSNAARRGNSFGLLRSPSSRRGPSRARLAGSAAANSTARCVSPEFMPNIEPVARGRHAEHAWPTPEPGALGIARQCVRAARQLPRGERRWPRRTGRPHCERARARACRLAAGAGRASRAERRPRSSMVHWHVRSP